MPPLKNSLPSSKRFLCRALKPRGSGRGPPTSVLLIAAWLGPIRRRGCPRVTGSRAHRWWGLNRFALLSIADRPPHGTYQMPPLGSIPPRVLPIACAGQDRRCPRPEAYAWAPLPPPLLPSCRCSAWSPPRAARRLLHVLRRPAFPPSCIAALVPWKKVLASTGKKGFAGGHGGSLLVGLRDSVKFPHRMSFHDSGRRVQLLLAMGMVRLRKSQLYLSSFQNQTIVAFAVKCHLLFCSLFWFFAFVLGHLPSC
jgi:hypothetical protein